MATIKKEITKKELVKKQSSKKNSGKTVVKKQTLNNEKKKVSKGQISKGKSNLATPKKQTKKVVKSSITKKTTVKNMPTNEKDSTKKEIVLEVSLPKEEKKVIEVELKETKEEKKKRFFSKFSKFVLPIFVIIGGVVLGIILYTPIDTIASNSTDVNCTYGKWKEEPVAFCLVSPDGKYFSNDSVIYEYNETTGMCIKKTRTKTCHY